MADAHMIVSDLFALSDALQMELKLDDKNRVSGSTTRDFDVPSIGLRIRANVKVVSSRAATVPKADKVPEVALLLRVQGQLYLRIRYDPRSLMVDCWVLNQSAMSDRIDGLYELYAKNTMDTLDRKVLMPAAVARFAKSVYRSEWTQLPLTG